MTTRFLDETPELFQLPDPPRPGDASCSRTSPRSSSTATRRSREGGRQAASPSSRRENPALAPHRPFTPSPDLPTGTRDRFKELGPAKFAAWVREQKRLLVTDTTMRDAHQSLLATRMRTYDMLAIADRYAREHADLFSLEMWGGATFDTAMRFLKESPWDRLARLRERVPNILFQMLLRAANAVGYTNYPDNVVNAFVKESAEAGIDVFRIFDANNWLPNLKLGIDAVLKTDAICEAAICYTGDILDPKRDKYTLNYYVESGEGAGEARHAHPRDQGHGRAAEAVRREEARARRFATGGRPADPLPHARLRRRADRVVPAGRGGGRGHRRLRVRPAGRA